MCNFGKIIPSNIATMGRHLTEAKRALIIHLYQQGKSQRDISKETRVARSTVQNTIKRFQEQGDFQERTGRGRKKKVTPRAERTLVRLSVSNRRLNSVDLCRELKRVYRQRSVPIHSQKSAHKK